MPLVSSTVTYPPNALSSSLLEKRKRKRQDELEIPLQRKKALSAKDQVPATVQVLTSALDNPDTVSLKARRLDGTPSRPQGPLADDDKDYDNGDGGDESNGIYRSMFDPFESRKSRTTDTAPIFESNLARPDNRWQQHSSYRGPLAKTSLGKTFRLHSKSAQAPIAYKQLVAERSSHALGRATKSYYGIDVHKLFDEAALYAKNEVSNASHPSTEAPTPGRFSEKGKDILWTEKYRATKFVDLIGDDRTHRDVLRWLKSWDPIVFPGTSRLKPKTKFVETETELRHQRKVLLLTGAPGLGKTTLAHVCAKQAGYEVVEINASDERSRDVVKGRIKDSVGIENVRGINAKDATGPARKAGPPVCVIVDEVDGVVSGSSSGGEGGFIKALIELITLDQKNSNVLESTSANAAKSTRKGNRFRLLRPIILICNDTYNSALRPLRVSGMAEIIDIKRPPLDRVVSRLKSIFVKEGVACDGDGVRRLCEATWGISDKRYSPKTSSGPGEGDMRGILVVGEWVAAKMRASGVKTARLTKKWIEEHMLENLSHGGGGARGSCRGSAKEVVERVFLDGAGFSNAAFLSPKNSCKLPNGYSEGVSGLSKHSAMSRLRDAVDSCGESDRIVTDCFASYPSRSFLDDTLLSKPNAAYEWLHFHDRLSSKVYKGQDWELGPYLSLSVLGFHHLFASPAKHSWATNQKHRDDDEEDRLPFCGPRADYWASEAMKQNRAILFGLHSSLSSQLLRSFRSAEDLSIDLLPSLIGILTPNVKPIVGAGSGDQRGVVSVRKEGEREMILRAVGVMGAVGVTLERVRVEMCQSGISSHVYRMEPPLDILGVFETAGQNGSTIGPASYAIRQALSQEYQKYVTCQRADARQKRYNTGRGSGTEADLGDKDKDSVSAETNGRKIDPVALKRDFFGRMVDAALPMGRSHSSRAERAESQNSELDSRGKGWKVWVSYHEGFSNAVRKPISLDELMRVF